MINIRQQMNHLNAPSYIVTSRNNHCSAYFKYIQLAWSSDLASAPSRTADTKQTFPDSKDQIRYTIHFTIKIHFTTNKCTKIKRALQSFKSTGLDKNSLRGRNAQTTPFFAANKRHSLATSWALQHAKNSKFKGSVTLSASSKAMTFYR